MKFFCHLTVGVGTPLTLQGKRIGLSMITVICSSEFPSIDGKTEIGKIFYLLFNRKYFHHLFLCMHIYKSTNSAKGKKICVTQIKEPACYIRTQVGVTAGADMMFNNSKSAMKAGHHWRAPICTKNVLMD